MLREIIALGGKVLGLVDELHTSEEEKMKIKQALLSVQEEMVRVALQYETRLMEIQGEVMKADLVSGLWIQKAWRPITMLTFLFIIVYAYFLSPLFDLKQVVIPDEMWTLFQVGFGGYIVGRSAEKIVREVKR